MPWIDQPADDEVVITAGGSIAASSPPSSSLPHQMGAGGQKGSVLPQSVLPLHPLVYLQQRFRPHHSEGSSASASVTAAGIARIPRILIGSTDAEYTFFTRLGQLALQRLTPSRVGSHHHHHRNDDDHHHAHAISSAHQGKHHRETRATTTTAEEEAEVQNKEDFPPPLTIADENITHRLRQWMRPVSHRGRRSCRGDRGDEVTGGEGVPLARRLGEAQLDDDEANVRLWAARIEKIYLAGDRVSGSDAAAGGAKVPPRCPGPHPLWDAINGDYVFRASSELTATVHAACGGDAHVYRFDATGAFPSLGATHAADVSLWFGNARSFPFLCGVGPQVQALELAMSSDLASFVEYGCLRQASDGAHDNDSRRGHFMLTLLRPLTSLGSVLLRFTSPSHLARPFYVPWSVTTRPLRVYGAGCTGSALGSDHAEKGARRHRHRRRGGVVQDGRCPDEAEFAALTEVMIARLHTQ